MPDNPLKTGAATKCITNDLNLVFHLLVKAEWQAQHFAQHKASPIRRLEKVTRIKKPVIFITGSVRYAMQAGVSDFF